MATTASSLPYHEPSILQIIILSGFTLLLNGINYGLDRLVYCGLIGQVVLGVAWGTPGAKWLLHEVEHAVVQLGYLGLILIVYEGGLATSFKPLKANLLLSAGVAATGIAVPIGLSFVLCPITGASPLQAFAAGAALCSTSLGTTFTVLGTSGLATTRMGVVLTSAAMMDDVVGLIMVQVISNLGPGSQDFNAVTVVRPILVSLGLASLIPAVCRFIIVPVTIWANNAREKHPSSKLNRLLSLRQTALVLHTTWLLGLVVGGSYAGTSSLLPAYVAGATISWWDSEVPHVAAQAARTDRDAEPFGAEMYKHYYSQAVERILKPFFFASIGFSIPITNMFSASIVWRGVVYTVLMVFGKLFCGVWLLSFATPIHILQQITSSLRGTARQSSKKLALGAPCPQASLEPSHNDAQVNHKDRNGARDTPIAVLNPSESLTDRSHSSLETEKYISVYPACILGLAMVARGEIGFLISALAESKGVFGGGSDANDQPSDLFLIVTWAISVCTIIGPVCVGLLVGRIKRLENPTGKEASSRSKNVLGAWGIS